MSDHVGNNEDRFFHEAAHFVTSQENLSSGFLTRPDTKEPVQLHVQKVARV